MNIKTLFSITILVIGIITICCNEGNYAYSYTDDYGNTTGFELNDNYFSAYTDNFVYTTEPPTDIL